MENFLNATKLLSEYNEKYSSNKVLAEFLSNKTTQQLIYHIKDKYGIVKPYIAKRGRYGVTLMHPELYQYFYNWLHRLPNKTFGRDEYEFCTSLETVFDGIYKLELQKRFDLYRVDLFIHDLNLAIEFDEKHHDRYKDKDLERQQYIQNKFNVDFIRHPESDSLFMTINKILKFSTNKITI